MKIVLQRFSHWSWFCRNILGLSDFVESQAGFWQIPSWWLLGSPGFQILWPADSLGCLTGNSNSETDNHISSVSSPLSGGADFILETPSVSILETFFFFNWNFQFAKNFKILNFHVNWKSQVVWTAPHVTFHFFVRCSDGMVREARNSKKISHLPKLLGSTSPLLVWGMYFSQEDVWSALAQVVQSKVRHWLKSQAQSDCKLRRKYSVVKIIATSNIASFFFLLKKKGGGLIHQQFKRLKASGLTYMKCFFCARVSQAMPTLSILPMWLLANKEENALKHHTQNFDTTAQQQDWDIRTHTHFAHWITFCRTYCCFHLWWTTLS